MFVSRVTRNANPSWLSSWRKNINYEAVLIYISLRPRKSYYFVIVISRLFLERRTYLLTYLLIWLHEWKEVDFLHRMFAKRGRKKNRRRINEISWFSCYSMLLVSFIYMYSPLSIVPSIQHMVCCSSSFAVSLPTLDSLLLKYGAAIEFRFRCKSYPPSYLLSI